MNSASSSITPNADDAGEQRNQKNELLSSLRDVSKTGKHMRITIAGRDFKLVTQSTSRHDILTMVQIRATGLQKLSQEGGESDDDFSFRLVSAAATHGDMYLLLGHLVLPAQLEGKQWTPDLARQTADFFADVTDAEDKAKVHRLIGSALSGFFL